MNKEQILNLPKGRFSWSQMSLWQYSPSQYKKQYFEGKQHFITPEISFGSAIAKLLEHNHPSVRFVPRLPYPEYKIETAILGVPTLSFLDSYDPLDGYFCEYKTGKAPGWTRERVDTHGQLLFYASAIRASTGCIPSLCHLIWLPTQKRKAVANFGSGKTMESALPDVLELTGEAMIFPRSFTETEIDAFDLERLRVAMEISAAYTEWQQEQKATQSLDKS